MTDSFLDSQTPEMRKLVKDAVDVIRHARNPVAFSHIDADGISALAIVVEMLKRLGLEPIWKNIHQLNSETIEEVKSIVIENKPDLVLFSDFGTGQRSLIETHLTNIDSIEHIIIMDHHLPQDDADQDEIDELVDEKIIEINPCNHGLSGSYDISGSGVAFLVAYALSRDNVDLTELAIVGATGDLQDFYGKGFTGVNEEIIRLGVESGYISVTRDLTFFGINTRPLPMLLEYSTDPFIPGLTGDRNSCFLFFDELGIDVKIDDDTWRTWSDLNSDEVELVIQKLFSLILESYEDPAIASGIIGDVITLTQRPPRTDLRSAKEFSTVLNACGRNRRADIGVRVCLGESEAIDQGSTLLHQHRQNLAAALRRLESDGFEEMPGIYVVNDPMTPDTIIGIVIGMAQGARIIPTDKPVIGVSINTSDEGDMVKISGRAKKFLVDRGLNLKEAFVAIGDRLNEASDELLVEAGGHPMAAGAFVHRDYLSSFLDLVSTEIQEQLA